MKESIENESAPELDPGASEKSLPKKIAVGVVGLVSLAWIFFPEPTDLVPVLGWLDEAAAAGIFLACLSYLGVNVGKVKSLFDKGEKARAERQEPAEKTVKGEVYDG